METEQLMDRVKFADSVSFYMMRNREREKDYLSIGVIDARIVKQVSEIINNCVQTGHDKSINAIY